LIAVVALRFLSPKNQLLFAFILLIGASFPDIDHPKSRMGRLAWPISYLFEHRGFFHSFFGIAFFTFLLFIISGSMLYSIAFLLGYASHILTDALTKQGIMPLHPILKFRLRGLLETGTFVEYALFFTLTAFGIFALFFLI
ncbi:metal-dependent hydrolase, partial [Candidatus Woesearchaeota archaeon]|nr:metal-dependent hydrolase [Candidatus Woesearchaeota archaeon]